MEQRTIGKERKYFIDWLRIGLIISVFFFHVGMIFRPEQWHVNSAESFEFLDPIMWWLHLWRMPLLFLVSGVGTYYALGHRSIGQYLKERFTRLFIPFAIGFFTLVPLMVYIERIHLYASFWDYIPHMFEGGPYPEGNISWHHLWFILYLFIISMYISPFLSYARSSRYKLIRGKLIGILSKRMGFNWLLPLLLLSQLVLRQYFPYSTHALYNDWAYFSFYLLFFLFGFVVFSSEKAVAALARDRRWYLAQTILLSILLFSLPVILGQPSTFLDYCRAITEITLSLSCGFTAIGYFKNYFNRDHRYRKVLNEAIYPFYLLHQPALIVVGHVVLQWRVSYAAKAALIIVLSLLLIWLAYWLLIRRIALLRVAFGMKRKDCQLHPLTGQPTDTLVLDK